MTMISVNGPSPAISAERASRLTLPKARASATGRLSAPTSGSQKVIRLAAGTFDPLHESPPSTFAPIDESTLVPTVPHYWLVQLGDSSVAEVVRAVKDAGATIAGYVADRAFIVRATTAENAEIEVSPGVRWSGLLQPSWRIAPGLQTLEGPQVYEVSVFREEPRPARTRKAVAGLIGARVLSKSSQRVLWVEATSAELEAIASIPAVEWVTLRPRYEMQNANARWVADTGVRDAYAATAPGRLDGSGQTIGVADLAVNYLPGPNERVLEYFSDCLAGTCKPADFVQTQPGNTPELMDATESTGSSHRKLAAYFDLEGTGTEGIDPSMHGAHVAGTATGDIGGNGTWELADGIAPAARLVHQNIEGPSGGPDGVPADSYDMWRQAYRPRAPGEVPQEYDPSDYGNYRPLEDARTHNNSYSIIDTPEELEPAGPFSLDKFVWEHEDMVVVTSAGNSGDLGGTGLATIVSPSTAKNDLSSAASSNGRVPMNSIDSLASFSSRGPTPDGRIGPTVATPGLSVVSAKGGSSDEMHFLAGTSMSAPVLTGLATLVREYFYEGWGPDDGEGFGRGQPVSERGHNPSAALVKAVIVNGAERMRGWHTGDDGSDRNQDGKWPSFGQGFGRANLDNSLFFEGDNLNNWYRDVWRADADAFAFPGAGPQEHEYELEVHDSRPFDITLAWTDAPSAQTAGSPDLVNNLDLVVTGPEGDVYVGNNFNTESDPGADEEFSIEGPAAPDTDNVEERVRIVDPENGTYTVSVTATEVFDGPQGFALAGSGAFGDSAPARGPGLLANESGSPAIEDVKVKPITGDTARVTWRTDEPTTGAAVLTRSGQQYRFADVYNLGEGGYAGIDEGLIKTSEEYANRPMPGYRHEVLATGLTPGGVYEVDVEATDLSGAKVSAPGRSLLTSRAVYGAAPSDIGSLKEEQADGWKTASQIYVGRYVEDLPTDPDFGNALGAFMFRLPESIDPQKVTGAAIRLYSASDVTNPYTDDSRYVVDLLEESVEPQWGTQTYEEIQTAGSLTRLTTTVAERRGGGTEYSYDLSCQQIESLRSTLTNDGAERMAAFRALAVNDPPDVSAFSYDFGFNEMSAGPHLRPQLVLFLEDEGRQMDLLPCDRSVPAPAISDVLVADTGDTPGTAMTVSWTTDVPSDSLVLFRARNSDEWNQVRSPLRTTNHNVKIDNLDPFRKYVFALRSRACNGKESTDTNNGEGYALTDPLVASTLAPKFTFEDGEQGWTTESNPSIPPDGWERSSPGDDSMWAWYLSPYQDETVESLISPTVSHPGGVVSLRWRDQREASPSELFHIEWSVDGGEWTTAETLPGDAPEAFGDFHSRAVAFTPPEGDLRVRYRWESHSIVSVGFFGVGLDNVVLLASSEAPDPDVVAEGWPPDSASLNNLLVPASRELPTGDDLDHGTMQCLPTVHPDIEARPRVRLRPPATPPTAARASPYLCVFRPARKDRRSSPGPRSNYAAARTTHGRRSERSRSMELVRPSSSWARASDKRSSRLSGPSSILTSGEAGHRSS